MLTPRAFYEWSRRRLWVFDVGVMAVLAFFTVPVALQSYGAVEVALSIALVLPLFWRRRRPVVSFGVIALACAAQVALVKQPLLPDVALLLALYALSAYAVRLWVRLFGLGVGLLGAWLGIVDWRMEPGLPNFMMLSVFVFTVWLLGDLMRTRRAHVAALEERARRLEFERDQQARIARSAERARIAREMHDVVAHSLAIMIAQADGGRYVADADPEAAKRALETIGQTGRRASAEMRRLLGVLKTEARAERTAVDVELAARGLAADAPEGSMRTPTSGAEPAEQGSTGGSRAAAGEGDESDPEPEYSPQPGVDRLSELIEQMRSGGLSCELTMDQPIDPLPEGLSLAAYRIVQEALTNTLKHGGPGVHATVELSQAGTALEILVQDDGRGAAATDDGEGHGLSGMSERVRLFGGRLRTGPRPGGGFRVHAEIPIRETASAGAP